MGVFTNYSGSSNFYIADNSFLGRNDPKHLISWLERPDFSASSSTASMGRAFRRPRDGTVVHRRQGLWPWPCVAYNYVADFHDGIDIETYGNPDGSCATDPNLPDTRRPKYPPREYWDRRPVAIDFYNNYMNNFHDNPFEMDGSLHNIRVMRNLMINSASHACATSRRWAGRSTGSGTSAITCRGGSTR